MSIERAVDEVLARLSDAQVEVLAATCESRLQPDGSLTKVVVGASPGAHDAVSELVSAWAARSSLTGDGVALALRVGLRARRDADAKRSRAVWTGPGAAGEQRLTAAVLHDLVTGADARMLLVSFAAYTLTELAADLEAAVQRGCLVDVVDGRRALVSSANLTHRALTANLEAGVLIEDRELAGRRLTNAC